MVETALSFDKLWHEELDEIAASRGHRGRPEPLPPQEGSACERAHQAALVGLAFSGGGIRSGTFNLGILQALASLKILRRFDYLSTVSGGGYIGSWLAAWIRREDLQAAEDGLSPAPAERAPAQEHDFVRSLRSYSNYLTPKLGMFSADTWTMVSIYLRNLVLNQGILILALAALLLVPRPVVALSAFVAGHPNSLLLPALGLLAFALLFTFLNLASISRKPARTEKYPRYTCPGLVQALVVFPIIAAAWCASCSLWGFSRQSPAPWFVPAFLERMRDASTPWHFTTWGTPLVVCALWLAGAVVIGLLGRVLHNEKREWASRAGAWLLIYSLTWIGLFGITVYGPLAILRLDEAWAGLTRLGLGPAWLLTTVGGLLAGRSSATGARESNRRLELLAKVAPYVFIAGLLGLISLGVHLVLAPAGAASYWGQMAAALESGRMPILAVAAAAVLVLLALFLSWRVDVNEFSMHTFYRNRLVRCYLGASNPRRRPHPSTGLSPAEDDLPIKTLAPSSGYPGPYPIVNGALNLTQAEELAWQRRKAASFVFTPRFCGFEVLQTPQTSEDCRRESALASGGYRPTPHYAYPGNGVRLGTAMAISGAAASPNMGYHTSVATAFLMTVFNVRLGWWLSNPRDNESWNVRGPKLGLKYLFGELFGLTNDKSPYVYVSDGGHFENLGIYELVRRRCRFIVACDGSEDRAYTFECLGNAIEKCRADFNINIEIDFEHLRPPAGERQSRWHCAVGKIRYDLADDGAPVGTLVYIKSSLTGDEPGDVKRYAAGNRDFPHQPTSDQWFDETQFESYRALGRHVAVSVFEAAQGAQELPDLSTEDLFLALRQKWYPPSPAVEACFSRHAAALDRINELIRKSSELTFLDAQIYPEWKRLMAGATHVPSSKLWLPDTHAERRAGFYICNQMIQLMENVYLDLKLEEDYDHPDNRGWMNLFRHWSWSGMFRVAWAIGASTFGARFQNFCRRHLDLDVRRDVIVGLPLSLAEAQREDTFNFFEKELLAQFVRQNPVLQASEVYPLQVLIDDPMRRTQDVAFLFTFGFALVGSPKERKALLYFRVQNHLRKMGLPREALAILISDLGILHTEPGQLVRDDDEAVTAKEQRSFAQLFEAVKAEVLARRT